MYKLLLPFLILIARSAIAQTGEIDQSFNANDLGLDKGSGFINGDVYEICALPGGDLIAVGNFDGYQDQYASNILRIDSDGNFSSLLMVDEFISTYINTARLQPDGKIMLGGNITYNGINQNIIRIDEFGNVDPTFQPVSGANNYVNEIEILDDGRMLISGNFSQYDGQTRNKLALIHADGTLDTSFNPGTGTNFSINALHHLADGTLLVAGGFTLYNGIAVSRFVALDQTGALSAVFPSVPFSGELHDILGMPDGGIMVCGSFFNFNGNSALSRMVKLDAWGIADPTFDPPSFDLSEPSQLALDANGKIIAAGEMALYNPQYVGVVRLNVDGSIDETFSHATSMTGEVVSIIAHDDGTITVAGAISEFHDHMRDDLFRLEADGNVAANFHPQYGPSSVVYRIAELQDGKLLISGAFNGYNGVVTGPMARIFSDGTLDESFQLADLEGTITDFEIQPDGKILIIGSFLWIEGEVTGYIARLTADGAWDESFNVDGGFNGAPDDILLLENGQVLLSGGFSEYSDQPCRKVVRLHTDGTIDANFGTSLYIAGGDVYCMALDPLGNIICGGDFTDVNLNPSYGLCKLSENGIVSSTFNTELSFSNHDVYSVAVDPDNGKIYICGFLNLWDSDNAYVYRLNANGSTDTSYHSGVYAYLPTDLYLMENKKLFVGGSFAEQIGDDLTNGIARLLEDGSFDPTFDVGVGVEYTANAFEVLENGQIMVGGRFQWIDSVGVSNLARLASCDFPIVQGVATYENCDLVELPVPFGYDLSDNVNYFDDSFENNGDPIPSWSITESQVVWLRDENDCGQAELPIDITIHYTPIIDFTTDTVFSCFSYVLPEITGQYLPEDIAYYNYSHVTSPNQLPITNLNVAADNDYFIYAANEMCSTEVEFFVDIYENFNVVTNYDDDILSTSTLGDSYQWVICGDPNIVIEGATSSSYQPTQNGSYAVIVERDGCEKKGLCLDVLDISVDEKQFAIIPVYPNPANDEVFLELSENTNVCLYDMLGNLMLNVNLNRGKQVIDLNGLSAGNYMLALRTGNGYSVVKLAVGWR